ncbi:MAG: hypothetical protein IJ054_05505 [Lachnospiraceae bacterium]|nr:hypothetical protein [Lachnospiraceae bacterium]MBQ9232892.1 hypothetical protein [Lachnospiraceae bacterium]
MGEISFETSSPIFYCAVDYSNATVEVAAKGTIFTEDVEDEQKEYIRQRVLYYLNFEITKLSGNVPVEGLAEKKDELAQNIINQLAAEQISVNLIIEDIGATASSIEPVAHLKKEINNGQANSMSFTGVVMSPGAANMIGNIFSGQ